MKRYGQYCPVARAAEVLAERWTLLVIRELLVGNERFNEIARGVPRMSPSLLAARLRELQRAGLVQRRTVHGQPSYRLTAAGTELLPVIEQIGSWGQRWMHALRPDEFDASRLMLDISRFMDRARLPEKTCTVHIHLPTAPSGDQHWWLVLGRDGVDVCDSDPGFPVRVWVQTDPATLTRIWLGDVAWTRAIRDEALRVTGDADAARALPDWLDASPYATVQRAPMSLPR